MKHRNPLLIWASQYHYPFLSLGDDSHIKHGEQAWRRFIAARNQKRILLAYQRIQRWNERMNEERTA